MEDGLIDLCATEELCKTCLASRDGLECRKRWELGYRFMRKLTPDSKPSEGITTLYDSIYDDIFADNLSFNEIRKLHKNTELIKHEGIRIIKW